MRAMTVSTRVPMVLAALLLAGFASAGPTQREAADLTRFEAAAGEPVTHFRTFGNRGLHGFSVLGEQSLAVWTTPRDAYLLRVDAPCNELRWALTARLDSNFGGRVPVHYGRVLVGDDRCRITEIRPIDTRALRAGLAQASGG